MTRYPDCPACSQGLAWDGRTEHVPGCPERPANLVPGMDPPVTPDELLDTCILTVRILVDRALRGDKEAIRVLRELARTALGALAEPVPVSVDIPLSHNGHGPEHHPTLEGEK